MITGYVLLHEAEDEYGKFKVIIPLVVSDEHPGAHKSEDVEEFIRKSRRLVMLVSPKANPIDIAITMDEIAKSLNEVIKLDPENFDTAFKHIQMLLYQFIKSQTTA